MVGTLERPMNAVAGRPKRRRPAATSLVGSSVRAERGLLGRVASTELEQALSEVTFPPLLAWDETGTVRLANHAAEAIFGRPLDEIVGTPLVDLAGPADEVEHVVQDMATGRFVAVHSHRTAHVKGGQDHAVLATSRAVEIDGLRGGVTVFVPEAEAGRLGRHPSRTWLDLVPVAVGFTDSEWIIETVTTEVQELIDRPSEALVGRSLLELIVPEDASELRASEARNEPRSFPQVRFILPSGDSVEVCVLLAPRCEPEGMRFALVGRIESYYPEQQDRVAELELRLQRIGAEVHAAGLLDTAALPALQDLPELGQLSTRQWEILSLLLKGERVPTIARNLVISPSTVRNHLTAIFQRFGVHSQAELLERLRHTGSGSAGDAVPQGRSGTAGAGVGEVSDR
jgi:PAS domain-containing protein/DNA-binding CsgD family transcriptional regulator